MGVSVQVVPATVEHARLLAPLLRAQDLAELEAFGGPPALECLVESVQGSDLAFAMLFDGEVAAVFGVVEYPDSGTGAVWALTGRAVAASLQAKKEFLRHSRRVLAIFLRRYQALENWVDARYLGAVRWLRSLEFEIAPPAPYGPRGMLHHHVVARRS